MPKKIEPVGPSKTDTEEQNRKSNKMSVVQYTTDEMIAAMKRMTCKTADERAATFRSPFDERSTLLLSRSVTVDTCVYLYKPATMDDPYLVLANGPYGTTGVHTSSWELYNAALKYLTKVYGEKPSDEDHECVFWEVYAPSDCGKCRLTDYCHCD